MAINLDHVTEQITVTDTAANASLTVNTKGTGAFNIAAGSSGVNLSNGGTVTAITRTNQGANNYTSVPTCSISAPTTAGGVQATATARVVAVGLTIQSGGSGYTAGDVLTVVGGTSPFVATITVNTVSVGVITTASITNFGIYSVAPSNPVSVTGGTGSGATFNLVYAIDSTFTITNAGSGYVEQPTVTFSGGGGSGAAAYAGIGGIATIKALAANVASLQFATPGGVAFSVADTNRPTVDFWEVIGSTGQVGLRVAGATPNNNGIITSKGSGYLSLQTNGFGSEVLRATHTASAVNYVQVTGAATGSSGGVAISAQGSDANVNLGISSKSNGSLLFNAGGTNRVTVDAFGGVFLGVSFSGGTALKALAIASQVNFIQAQGAVTGFGPVLSAQGSDTNINAVLQPKGTGALQAQQTDSTATGGNARGVNAVDWQTGRDIAAQVASGAYSVISGGYGNRATSTYSATLSGGANINSSFQGVIAGGTNNQSSSSWSGVFTGNSNVANGFYNFVGGGWTNTATSSSAVTTQSGTMNGTTAVTLSGSNASIKVGQYISGTSIAQNTYVAAISGTSLTLSQAASGSSTSTLSFFTPHGVVVGGGNNQATGCYSFIGGGGDAGTAANRNVASGNFSVVVGGIKNTASGLASVVVGGGTDGTVGANTASGTASFIGGGISNLTTNIYAVVVGGSGNLATGYGSTVLGGSAQISNGTLTAVVGGQFATTRSIGSNIIFGSGCPIAYTSGVSQAGLLVLGAQTTNATATVLTSEPTAASTTNQVILPNNSAYYFRGEVVSGVTGGGDTKGFFIEGVIKRGANAASTALVGTPTVTSNYADAGASAWTIAVTADTTNGGLAVTFTGQAGTTIRTVAQIRTTEMTF